MSNALYDRGRQGFLEGDIDWIANDIRVILTDVNNLGTAVTGATNATPIVVTSTAHGLNNGDRCIITGVAGNAAANGRFVVANVTANTFELTDWDTQANVAGSGAYTSGGLVIDLSNDEDLADIPGTARIAVSGALTSKTATDGVADAADVVWSAVTGNQSEAIIIYQHTGTEATALLIACLTNVTGLPVTPNGGDINLTWANTINRIFRL